MEGQNQRQTGDTDDRVGEEMEREKEEGKEEMSAAEAERGKV